MSKERTGNLWPNKVKDKLSESQKQTFMLLSSKDKAYNSPFGINFTH